jgi:hypothetical protein
MKRTPPRFNLPQVTIAPVKMTKKRLCHQARRRLPAKMNSQFSDTIEASKRTQVMRRTFPRPYENDATKTEREVKP